MSMLICDRLHEISMPSGPEQTQGGHISDVASLVIAEAATMITSRTPCNAILHWMECRPQATSTASVFYTMYHAASRVVSNTDARTHGWQLRMRKHRSHESRVQH